MTVTPTCSRIVWLVTAGVACATSVDTSKPLDDEIARYTVTFTATWSANTHPDGFPGNPHFSGLIGATHSNALTIWQAGNAASAGIKDMAELGAKSALESEIDAAIADGVAGRVLSGGGIGRSPGTVELTFEISQAFPLVTLVSMLAPSPDWFVGVHGLVLRENGSWVDRRSVPLAVYDAGTDSGSDYASANLATSPAEPIAPLTAAPFDRDTIVGTFEFIRR